MKRKQLEKLIREYFPTEVIEWFSFDDYDTAELFLNGGGKVSIGLEPPTKRCNFNFLHFNIRYCELRLKDSHAHTGKINYFGDEPKEKLIEYLKELKSLTQIN